MVDKKRPRGESIPPKGPSQRMLQVGEEIRYALAGLLRHYQPFPDQAREVSVTVTEVRMSPDLKHATVFVMPLALGDETALIVASLKKNAGALTRRLAGQLPFKFLPFFHFILDDSLEHAQRIEALLRQK